MQVIKSAITIWVLLRNGDFFHGIMTFISKHALAMQK